MYHLADLRHVVFGVTAEQGEFSDYEFKLPTSNNQLEVLLEDIETIGLAPPQTRNCEQRAGSAASSKTWQQDFGS